VAARYTFRQGFVSAYPETTGYIIPTLFQYSDFSRDHFFREMAFDLGDWLMGLQFDEGGFPGGHLDQGRGPVVFNTGQILIGLLEIYRRSGDERCLDACVRCGRWLVDVQDDDGAWRRFSYSDRVHAYHTRVAWPLVETGFISGEDAFVKSGRANLDFVLGLQEDNGWFRHNTLDFEGTPYTHTLAYAARGLLECGLALNEGRYIDSAEKLAFSLLKDFESRGFLPGQYDEALCPVEGFSCLTGNAQMSIIWIKLARARQRSQKDGGAVTGRYLAAASRINRQIMHCQNIYSNNPGIRGAVPGSWPISGPYIRYGYPNWAAKFLADALMLEMGHRKINPAV